MDEKKDKLLIQYFEQELSDEQEKEVLHMIAEDPEMRSMLHFERQVRRTVPELDMSGSFEVPSGFRAGVMHAIEAEEKEKSPAFNWRNVLDAIKSLWQPREIALRPVYAICSLLVVIALAGAPYFYGSYGPDNLQQEGVESGQFAQAAAGIQAEQVWTRFVYLDENAESVAVAGDFSDWEPVELSRETLNGEQVWTGLVPMSKGENKYMFVKDGSEWVTDPLATTYENDGFGNRNAVIYL